MIMMITIYFLHITYDNDDNNIYLKHYDNDDNNYNINFNDENTNDVD